MGRILVVDDHPDTGRLLARLLRHSGHAADYVESGPAAIQSLTAVPADLVLLDVMMPGMDGLEVLRTLRATPSFGALPVVMYSAATDEDFQREAQRLGAQDYLIKGQLQWSELQSVIESYVGTP